MQHSILKQIAGKLFAWMSGFKAETWLYDFPISLCSEPPQLAELRRSTLDWTFNQK